MRGILRCEQRKARCKQRTTIRATHLQRASIINLPGVINYQQHFARSNTCLDSLPQRCTVVERGERSRPEAKCTGPAPQQHQYIRMWSQAGPQYTIWKLLLNLSIIGQCNCQGG